eukprot:SAG11_NODE_15068_length_590_cov_0.947047_1_plen_60_part_10
MPVWRHIMMNWQVESLFARVLGLGLATEAAVKTMKRNVQMGRFNLEHYVDMYQVQLRCTP